MNPSAAGREISSEVVARLDELAACSEQASALTRMPLSDAYRQAIALTTRWMEEAGLATSIDPAGNLVGRLEGPAGAALVFGSHLDTVRNAGRYDGALGVVLAISCLKAWVTAAQAPDVPIEVVAFTDEEGVRFQSPLFGSRAMAGGPDPASLQRRDADGTSLEEAMTAFGLDPSQLRKAARPSRSISGYVEAHIEQGPVLEAAGTPIGVVTAIAGATRLEVAFKGRAGHAGTVPMERRQDALATAAEAILAVERICRDEFDNVVGTVGQITAHPGSANVIPGAARLTIDFRSESDRDRYTAIDEVTREIERICSQRHVDVELRTTFEVNSTPLSKQLNARLIQSVRANGLPAHQLPSGAGHDAMAMARVTEAAMLFVRCRDGISHDSSEYVAPEDIAIAADVLLHFIRTFGSSPEPA